MTIQQLQRELLHGGLTVFFKDVTKIKDDILFVKHGNIITADGRSLEIGNSLAELGYSEDESKILPDDVMVGNLEVRTKYRGREAKSTWFFNGFPLVILDSKDNSDANVDNGQIKVQ